MRRAIFAVVSLVALLALAQAWLDHSLRERVGRQDFRFLVHSLAGYPELKANLVRDTRPKVLFVGDSALQGGATEGDRGTIPYGYHLALPAATRDQVRVVNAGLAGSSLDLNRRVVEDLSAAKLQTVFLLLNYVALQRPLWNKAYAGRLGLAIPENKTAAQRVEARLQGFLDQHVSLIRNRGWLVGSLWGTPPDRGVARFFYVASLVGWRDAAARDLGIGPPRRWSDTAWNEDALRRVRAAFNLPKMGPQREAVRTLDALGRTARAAGAEFIVINAPVNRAMLDRYALWDAAGYADNVRFVRRRIEASGGVFLDGRDWVGSEVFVDSHHLCAEGNRLFGEKLAAWHLTSPETGP